jgi:hypothetical protein
MKKLIAVLAISVALVFSVRMLFTDDLGNSQIKNQISYMPKASSIKVLALGHTNSLSSLYWISAIVGLGDSYLTGVKYKWFNQVANLVTTLDPQWKIVYEFTGGVADTNDVTVDSVMIRGIHNYPKDWRISTYYAMYVVNERKDYAMASKVMKPFENRKDIPEHITRMSKSFATFTMPKETATIITLEDYYNPQNRGFKRAIARRLLKLLDYPSEDADLNRLMLLLERVPKGQTSPDAIFKILMGNQGF